MKNLKLLSKYFFFFLFLVSASLQAETLWDVAAVFLGAADLDGQEKFQQDIDQNILELARIQNLKSINLQIVREMPGKSFSYTPAGKKEITLQSLLHETKTGDIKINGDYKTVTRRDLGLILNKTFKSPTSKKILIIYGHGKGAEGLLDMPVQEFKTLLSQLENKPDIIWFDSCFQANAEFLFELRKFGRFSIASEEAEFSSGLPFQALELLPQISNLRTASLMLAKTFIESYSYSFNGSQRHNVQTSSATISVIDNTRLETIVPGIQSAAQYISSLESIAKKKLSAKLREKYSMENKDLIDLGRMLIELRLQNTNREKDLNLTSIIRELNIDSVAELKTNPRVRLNPPRPNALLVYGFNQWQVGSQLSSPFLPTENFVIGPRGKSWPLYSPVGKNRFITPFAPGISSFHYYWIDSETKQKISAEESITRISDVIEKTADSKVVVYQAYTQAEGARAERYTGLNISNFTVIPSIDLFETELIQQTQWLSL